MEQKLLQSESVFGRVPLAKEKLLVSEVYILVSDAFGRSFLPTVCFNPEKVKYDLKLAKNKLQEMGLS